MLSRSLSSRYKRLLSIIEPAHHPQSTVASIERPAEAVEPFDAGSSVERERERELQSPQVHHIIQEDHELYPPETLTSFRELLALTLENNIA